MSERENGETGLRRHVRTVCRSLFLALLILLLLGCAVLIVQSLVPADRMPGLLRPAAESNNTMAPTLRRGDFLLFRTPGSGDGVQVGDVVSFRAESGFALGRVVAADADTVQIKGDAEADSMTVIVSRDALRGVWNGFRIPFLGYPILLVQTAPGCLLVVLGLLLIDTVVWAAVRKRRLEESRDETVGFAASLGGVLLVFGGLLLWLRSQGREHRRGGRNI